MAKRIDRTGETKKAKNGQTMTIVEYINANHIVVEFDDKQKTRVKTSYGCFKKGETKNPNFIPHIGETSKAYNGQTMTIVEYINCTNIIVEFDDKQKTRVKATYYRFTKGKVKNPNYHIGETNKATNSQTMTIVEYNNTKHIVVEFDDEFKTRVKTTYHYFKVGSVNNPNFKTNRNAIFFDKRIGKTHKATNGQTMTIVEYINANHIVVEFDDEQKTRVKTTYDRFIKGRVKNPNDIPHIGETNTANNGQTMTIVEYINYKNIIVEFDDEQKTHVKTYYSCFKAGEVKNPNFIPHIGETSKAKNGQTMTIVEYINANHIVVEFDDEQKTRVKTSYYSFKDGKTKNPNFIPHIGETSKAKNGQTMTIVEYINYYNIIVEFDDEFKTHVKTSYYSFKDGKTKNPNFTPRIGETKKAKNGQTMTIVEYINAHRIVVEFDDEQKTQVRTSYKNFKKGETKNPNYMPHIGETSKATNGQTMTIMEYINANHIVVEFDDEQKTRVKTSYGCFKKGTVKNPCFSMRGEGTYKTFQTQYAYTAPDGKVYFYCECQKCGFKANLTAKEVIGLNHGCWKPEDGEIICQSE